MSLSLTDHLALVAFDHLIWHRPDLAAHAYATESELRTLGARLSGDSIADGGLGGILLVGPGIRCAAAIRGMVLKGLDVFEDLL